MTIQLNPDLPLPKANTGSAIKNWLSDASTSLVHLERRFDPFVRPAFDALLRGPLTSLTTALINSGRANERLKLAEEMPLPDEDQWVDSIIKSFQQQMTLL